MFLMVNSLFFIVLVFFLIKLRAYTFIPMSAAKLYIKNPPIFQNGTQLFLYEFSIYSSSYQFAEFIFEVEQSQIPIKFLTDSSYIFNFDNKLMLIRHLLRSYQNFGRNLKPPKTPPNLKELKGLQKPMLTTDDLHQGVPLNKQLQKQDKELAKQVRNMVRNGMTEEEIINMFVKQNKDELFPTQKDKHNFEHRKQIYLKEASQSLLISEILKESNLKEKPIGQKYSDKLQTEEEMHIKENKLIRAIREKKNIDNLDLKTIDEEDRLYMKFDPEIIDMAKKAKQSQLKYFKQLTQRTDDYYEFPNQKNLLLRRPHKDETLVERIQKDRQKRQKKKLEIQHKKQLQELVKIQKQIQEKQSDTNHVLPTLYENEKFYKDKALREFQQVESNKIQLSEGTKELLHAGQEDLQNSKEVRQIMIEQIEDSIYEQDSRKQIYEESSFGKQEKKVKILHERLLKQGFDVDMVELKKINKQILFDQKKVRQEMLEYQKYLQKKEKRKKMDQLIKSIHQEKLREDLDYEIDYKDRFKSTQYNPLDVQANIQKVKELNKEREALLVSKDRKSEIHFMKTERMIKQFINAYFYQNLYNPNSNIQQVIKVIEYHFNEKKTLIHIFWKFQFEIRKKRQSSVEEQKVMYKKLQKCAPYISGKMTQILGLRYGPDIRFHHDYMLKQTLEIVDELKKYKKEIIQSEIKSLKQNGHISNQKEEKQYRKKLQATAKQNLAEYNNRKTLLRKRYIKEEEKLMGNKKKQRKQEKKNGKRQNHIDKFWNAIDS